MGLYFGYLQSDGSGVGQLLNLGRAGITTTDLRMGGQLATAVARIDSASDTKVVTLDIGINTRGLSECTTANQLGCPAAGDLRAILTTLNDALARDPGNETVQVMEYFNADVGTAGESFTREWLLGSDLKVDCSGTGAALGLNDLIHCTSIEEGATPVDVLPVFDAAGKAFISSDGVHPNDGGYLAIAKALGGAATPIFPPPPPILTAGKPRLSKAQAGKPLTASIVVTNAYSGRGIKGEVACQGKVAGKPLAAKSHSSLSSGRTSCTWRLPTTAHNKQFKGSITSSVDGSKITRSFSTMIK